MKNKIVPWTLVAKAGGEKSTLQTLGTFDMKRKAVREMEARRQPKTAVLRIGHSFIFQPVV